MSQYEVVLHSRAQAALELLPQADRALVLRVTRLLSSLGPSELHPMIKVLASSESLYYLRAGSSLRIIFRQDGSKLEVLDVVRPGRLRKMFSS